MQPMPRMSIPKCEQSGKRSFPDEAWARMAAQTTMRRRRRQMDAEGIDRLYVYECPHCKNWHCTKKDIGIKWMVTREKQYWKEGMTC